MNNIRYEVTNDNGNYSVIGGPQNALSQLTYDASNNQIKFTTRLNLMMEIVLQ